MSSLSLLLPIITAQGIEAERYTQIIIVISDTDISNTDISNNDTNHISNTLNTELDNNPNQELNLLDQDVLSNKIVLDLGSLILKVNFLFDSVVPVMVTVSPTSY